jgi:hypothetical protein
LQPDCRGQPAADGAEGLGPAGPCKSKVRRPPSEAALAEAERLRGQQTTSSTAERVVIDLSHYAAVAEGLRHVPPPKEEDTTE